MAKAARRVKQCGPSLARMKKPNLEREKRLAEALRSNLRKRKQPRADAADQPPEAAPKR